jgi:type I restriction enzyme M protein
LRLYGQEVQATTAAIARMNLYLHDIETFSVKRGDTLRDPRFREPDGSLTRFDAVIANPPFSLKNWGRVGWSDDPFGRADFGIPPDAFGDFAFVEHMLASAARPHGRIAVVMPHGVLFRSGVERDIRRRIVDAGLLRAVVGLPPNLFYSTSIPACVLLLDAAGSREAVLFVDASRRFAKGRNQNELTPDDVTVIAECVESGLGNAEQDVLARHVDFTELEANGWDLSVGRYLQAAGVDGPDIATAVAAYVEAVAELDQAQVALLEQLAEAGLNG